MSMITETWLPKEAQSIKNVREQDIIARALIESVPAWSLHKIALKDHAHLKKEVTSGEGTNPSLGIDFSNITLVATGAAKDGHVVDTLVELLKFGGSLDRHDCMGIHWPNVKTVLSLSQLRLLADKLAEMAALQPNALRNHLAICIPSPVGPSLDSIFNPIDCFLKQMRELAQQHIETRSQIGFGRCQDSNTIVAIQVLQIDPWTHDMVVYQKSLRLRFQGNDSEFSVITSNPRPVFSGNGRRPV
ncbi:hypothetical protein QFC21_007094 [Naganishia friedmannii]|uniref:Uncharacterized protein n=1 Tax=Naganishia friedmannii TaxID=89922 RepID=A0ACC2UYH5_9TREE|nr:hypothetical protein QFC21_007094 [Naganishia friedmannii]